MDGVLGVYGLFLFPLWKLDLAFGNFVLSRYLLLLIFDFLGQWRIFFGSIVLLHDTRREKDMSRKLSFKWLGPYKICDGVKDKGTYMLEEPDGSRLKAYVILKITYIVSLKACK